MNQCVVRGCSSAAWKKRGDAHLVDSACGPADGQQHLHRVPNGAWADFCRPVGGCMPAVAFICSRHFLPKDYSTNPTSRRRSMQKPVLLPAAEPTQNSPDSFGAQLWRPPMVVVGPSVRGTYRPRGHSLARRNILLSVVGGAAEEMDPVERARVVQEAIAEYENRENPHGKHAANYSRRLYRTVDSPAAKSRRFRRQAVTRSGTSSPTGEESPMEEDEPVRSGHWLANLPSPDMEPFGGAPTDPSATSELIGNGAAPSQTAESPFVENQATPTATVKIKEENEEAHGADSELPSFDVCDSDGGNLGSSSVSSSGGEESPDVAAGDSEDPADPARAAPADSLVTMWPFVQVVDGTPDSAAEQRSQPEETPRTAVPAPRRVITVHPTRHGGSGGSRVLYVPNPAVSGTESAAPQRGVRTITVCRAAAAPEQQKAARPSGGDDADVKRMQEELDQLRQQLADSSRQVRVWRGLLSREASRLGAPCASDVDTAPREPPTLNGEDRVMSSDDSEIDDVEMPALASRSVTCTFPLNKFPVLPADRPAAEAAHRLAVRQMSRLQVSAMRDKVALRRAQLRLLEHRLESRLAQQRSRRRLSSLLTPAQCSALEGAAPQCWPKEDIQRAVQLRSACGKTGYRWLQRHWKLPLPPLSSLPTEAEAEAENGPEVNVVVNVKTEEL